MIYTVTLNPALDYVMHLDSLILGKINTSRATELIAGGKGINVSHVLTALGVPNMALGFVAGFTGQIIEQEVCDFGGTADFIHLAAGMSRINVKLRTGAETDINAAGPAVSEEDLERLYSQIETISSGDTLVLSGSAPGNLPPDIYEKITMRLPGRGVELAVDAAGELLLKTLRYCPFLIKPNLEELCGIFGKDALDEDETAECALKLRAMGARNVLVSKGIDGATLFAENGKVYHSNIINKKPVDTVGAGDAMLGGFLAGWHERGDYEYALMMGSAAGAATAATVGIAAREEILAFLR